jgi:hypothetical protein
MRLLTTLLVALIILVYNEASKSDSLNCPTFAWPIKGTYEGLEVSGQATFRTVSGGVYTFPYGACTVTFDE